jgi:tetratricopeptide (TPR) repeat protein
MGRLNEVADLYGRCARAAWDGGDTPRGLALGQEGLAVVEGTPDSSGYAHLLHETARAYLFNGILDEAEPLCQRALNMAQEVGALSVQVEALTTLSLLPSYPIDDTISMLKEAVSLAKSAGLLKEVERASFNLGTHSYWFKGNFKEAVRHINYAIKTARSRGDLALELFYYTGSINPEIVQGNIASAKRSLERPSKLLEMVVEPGSGALSYYWCEAMFYRACGDIAPAIKLLGEMVERARTSGDLQMLQIIINDLGEILVTETRFEEAAAILNEGIDLGDKGLIAGDVKTLCLMSLVLVNSGDEERAHAKYREAEVKTQANGYRFADRIWVPWTMAHLSVAKRNWPDAWTAFEEAVEVVTSYKANWYRAKWQLEWAQAHLQRGETRDRERAKELLQSARSEFEAMGVGTYVEQATKLLENLA